LTIAGSDSGGGAGIQADLKTFAVFGVFGVSAVTAITAQNPLRIAAIQPVSAAMVRRQIEAVCDYFNVTAVKTGMLHDKKIVSTVANEIKRRKIPIVVVDPLFRATSGKLLLTKNAFQTLLSKLLPLATVITPNVPEAEMLLRCRIKDQAGQRRAAVNLSKKFNTACVIKGGHLPGGETIDVLCHNRHIYSFKARRLKTKKTHGTGCAYSAALAACLARGMSLKNACAKAKKHVFQLINDKKKLRIV